ncbi:MAG: UPF0280 family protein [Methanomicrobiales archaeon]|nr:UPF0280 family protein [Methanomicrobiales archaeon]
MIRRRFHLRETIATILADDDAHIGAARDGIIAARQELERYAAGDPFFLSTLEPYPVSSGIAIVDRMADAGVNSGVGPMAAVAGAIAWAGVEAMQEAGAAFGIVDNGGDIAMLSDRDVTVGIHAGASPLSDRLGFVIGPDPAIRGICTSSATVGHSLSFGSADSVTVFSRNPAGADAWATAICNTISPEDTSVLGRVDPGEVDGVLVIIGSWLYRWGCIPDPIRVSGRPDLITGGLL